MSKTTLHQLGEFGQSIWLDNISRPLLDTGKLKGLIDQGLRGMTSNPSIFNQAIGTTSDYDKAIVALTAQGKSTFEIYDELTIKDIQDAADQFRPTFDATNRLDGYVSLEINPQLASKFEEQAKEGVRLCKKVNRPNVMIKVPSTPEGIPVVEELIAQGINVNVTLIFSLKQYEDTVQAYFRGLNRLSKTQSDLSHIRSVASVFVSRVDTMIDKILDDKIAQAADEKTKAQLKNLKGKAAVANCHVILDRSRALSSSNEFKNLFEKKANWQRVLWASTSTKNPDYKDIKYISELITKPTVNTLPQNTLDAFLDHGQVKEAFQYNVKDSQKALDELKAVGIDINQVCAKLLDEGVVSFDKAFEALMSSIEKKASQLSVTR